MSSNRQQDTNALAIEAQGSLFAIAARANVTGSPIGGPRGAVTGFSEASRRRLLRKMARLAPQRTTFITLTYPDNMTDDQAAYAQLRALLERFRRRWPKCSAIWRKEYQDRGAIHYHLMVFNMPWYPFEDLRQEWAEIIGHHFPSPLFVRIEKIRSKKGCMFYISKYMAKPQEGFDLALLDYVAYPHAAGPTDPYAQFRPPLPDGPKSRGRFWGIFNKDCLPYAPQQFLTIRVQSYRSLHDIKRIMRREWRFVNKQRQKGGVLFTDRAYGLWAMAVRLAIAHIHDEWFSTDLITIGA